MKTSCPYVYVDPGKYGQLLSTDSRRPDKYEVLLKTGETIFTAKCQLVDKAEFDDWKPQPVATTKKPARGKKT